MSLSDLVYYPVGACPRALTTNNRLLPTKDHAYYIQTSARTVTPIGP